MRYRPAATAIARHRGRAAAGLWADLFHRYAPLVGLLLLVGALGQVGVGAARVLFIGGSLAVGILAYRRGGLGLHAEVSIALFVLGPFLRRIIDLHAGYDVSATILVGPLLALTAAFPELRALLSRRTRLTVLTPFLLITACITYGWTISAIQTNLLQPSIAATKYMLPMLYGMCLALRPDESDRVLQSAARAFLVLSPVIGFYGIAQYLSPPKWDTYWMISSKMLSIGFPEARKLRVFSTMNSPTSFAFYASCGLLLFSFIKPPIPRVLVVVLALLPLSVALLLSGVRTAWISTAIALCFCLLFKRTRSRAGLLIAGLLIGMAVTLAYTSLGDSIAGRLSSLGGNLSQDGSGNERLHDYEYVFTEGKKYLFGVGLNAPTDPRMVALDGQLLISVVQMGLVIGAVHMLLILWAGSQALLGLTRSNDVLRVVAGSVVVAQMAVFLLLGFSFGEIGFLFWMLVGALTPGRAPAVRRQATLPAGALPSR